MGQVATVEHTRDSQIIAGNSMVMLGRRAVLWVLSGLLVLFTPRYLGDEGLGKLAFAQSMVGLFITAMSLGVGQYLIKAIARDRDMIARYLPAAIGMRLVATMLAFAAIALFAHLAGYSGDARTVIFIAAATAIVVSFSHLMASVLYGLENMAWPALAEVAGKLVVVSVGVAVLVQGLGVVPYAMVLLAAAGVNLLLNAGYIARRFSLKVSFEPQAMKALFISGMPFLMMGVIMDVYNQADTVVLRFMTTEAVVGWYAAAVQIYKTLEMVPIVLTTALLPTLSRVHVNSTVSTAGIARKSIVVVGLVIVPLGLGISLLSSEIIRVLPYPEGFTNTVPLLTILALTIPITAFLTVLGTIAVAVDRQKAWALGLLVTVTLNVASNVVAASYFQEHYGNGGIGVALTTLLSEVFMVALGVRLMPRGIITWDMGISLVKVLVAGGVMVAAGLAVRWLGGGPVPLVAASSVAYCVAVLATRVVTLEDLRFLVAAVRRKVSPAEVTHLPRSPLND